MSGARHGIRSLALLAAALASAAPGGPLSAARAAGPAVVSIRPAATVRQPLVRLRDIADIAAADPGLASRLGDLEVGRAPLPGLSRAIDLSYVRMCLRRERDLPAVAVEGAPAAVVTAASQTVRGEVLLDAVRAHLAAEPGREGDRLILRAAGQLPELVLPPGALELKVQARPGTAGLGSLAAVVEAWVDGAPVRSVSLAVRVARVAEVVVAARPIARHALLAPEDLRVERREVTAPPRGPDRPAALLGQRAVRAIGAGEPVLFAMVEPAPLVRRGDLVLLVAEGRGVRAMSPGEAREEGRAGQVIRVRNLSSGRDVRGQVEAEGRVRVHF